MIARRSRTRLRNPARSPARLHIAGQTTDFTRHQEIELLRARLRALLIGAIAGQVAGNLSQAEIHLLQECFDLPLLAHQCRALLTDEPRDSLESLGKLLR